VPAEHDDPRKVTTRSIRAGEDYPTQVEGGFIRTTATEDGVLVENSDVTLFVAVAELEQRMAELGRACIEVRAEVELHTRDPGPGRVRVLKRPGDR
jgi:hypothetical protein